MEDVQELKALLIEAAFRRLLNREAAIVLSEQAERLLNQDSDYKIAVECALWL